MSPFQFTNQTGFYSGKVRDVYSINDDLLVMIASDRLSAFDVILPCAIPFKGQVLNRIAAYMLGKCSDICENWLLETPAANASIGRKCKPFKIEMVVRGNLTGHSWRTYQEGKRTICGMSMPEGMRENDFFPQPIITPSTKAHKGHDEDISKEDIIIKGLASDEEWETLENYALKLFKRGNLLASNHGLILADTKYEFGTIDGKIFLMDEIHTPDSSRYFYADGFQERLEKNKKQKQLSKEFVREWLIENNFMGRPGESIPHISAEKTEEISARYIELYEQITGEIFIAEDIIPETLYMKIETALKKYEH